MHLWYEGAYWSYSICCQYMYVNTLYRCISLYFWTIIGFYVEYIYAVTTPVCIVMVPFIHIWTTHTDLETVFRIDNTGSLWLLIIPDVGIVIDYCGVFASSAFFTCIFFLWRIFSNSLYDWLGVSCLTQKLIGPNFLFILVVRSLYHEGCWH